MEKSLSTTILIIICLVGALVAELRIEPVRGNQLTIYIRADGSIDPPGSIKRNVDTYTLVDNIRLASIVVQRNNSVLDGAGYGLYGGGMQGIGINVSRGENITFRNLKINGFEIGIHLVDYSQGVITENSFLNNRININLYQHCNSNEISRNNVTGGETGIFVSSSSNCRIFGNAIVSSKDVNHGFGIYLQSSSNNNALLDNVFDKCGLYVLDSYANNVFNNTVNAEPLVYLENASDYVIEDGGQVVLINCRNMTVKNLNLSYASVGVQFWGTNDSRILKNNIVGSGCEGIRLDISVNNTIIDNTIEANADGMLLSNSSNNDIVKNKIKANLGNGINVFHHSELNNITENSVNMNDMDGIMSFRSSNSISRNTIAANNRSGIYLEHSDGSFISENRLENNTYGFLFRSSQNNTIYHNNILNNTVQSYDLFRKNDPANYPVPSISIWDNGYRSWGNYWGHSYTGADLHRGLFQNETGSDGIGDTAYGIDENNQDNYPLMNLWHEPPWTPLASFNHSPLQPCINETVTFDAWTSYDFDGQIVNYLWDFGDGIVVNETNPIANHTYTFPRFYNVSLTVVDNEGLSNTTERTINVIKISANLSISSALPTLILRGNTKLKGSIAPVRAQTNVTIWSKAPSQNEWVILANITTDEYGNYSYNWTPSTIGAYTIKANWTGDEYTFPSETNSLVVTCTRIPTSLSILTTSSPTLSGFKVEVKGTLAEIYGTILGNETIVLYYTFAGIGTWTPITSDTTGSLGEYNIVWFPPATGYFLLKAEWPGDAEHLGTSSTIAVNTMPFENQYVFTVESNSTISDLSFDTTSRRLRFTASGENGTKGYTRVTIAKNLVSDAASLKVHVDGVEYNYTVAETNDSWMLLFTYNHSSHFIEIELNLATPNLLPFLLPPSLVVVALVAVVLVRRRRGRKKSQLNKEGQKGII